MMWREIGGKNHHCIAGGEIDSSDALYYHRHGWRPVLSPTKLVRGRRELPVLLFEPAAQVDQTSKTLFRHSNGHNTATSGGSADVFGLLKSLHWTCCLRNNRYPV